LLEGFSYFCSMNKKPLILVSNDDGIFAPGIKALVEVATEFGEVVVVAPDSAQSAQSHALTLYNPLRLKKVSPFGEIEAYECSGTPVDCVKLAKNVVLKGRKADLCVSGINHGANSSINIIYSGTMSAAMEGSLEDIDSIGFSLLDYSFDADFKPCKPFIRKIIKQTLAQGLPNCKLLNVNIPKLPIEQIKGIKVCRQAEARWVEDFQEAEDPRGYKYYWMAGDFINYEKEATDTDVWALENGYVSVVPSSHDLTKYDSIPNLKYLEEI